MRTGRWAASRTCSPLLPATRYFRDGRAAGAEQFEPGFPALVQLLRGELARLPRSQPELGCGGVIDQDEIGRPRPEP